MNRTFYTLRNTTYGLLFLGYVALLYYGVIQFDWNLTNWFNLRDLDYPEPILNIEPIVTGLFISLNMSICVAYQCSKLFAWLANNFNCLRWLV
ncbi:hypothetical protein ABRZ80_20580 [Vibrio vulnificus]|uniref:hypothetical protein n=1 Tax=Vibrio vulnificus TaxID=672 RepID=UPI0032EE9475